MSTVSYTGLIPENVAPENATGIAVYKGGKEICKISDMGVLARLWGRSCTHLVRFQMFTSPTTLRRAIFKLP